MALTISNPLSLPYRIVGNQKETVRDVTFDTEYAKEGETLPPSELGLNSLERAVCNIQKVGGTVNVAESSYYEEKLHLFDETPAEVEAGKDVSKIVVRVVSRGS